jgi:alpha-L-glutamate ligase-like protein
MFWLFGARRLQQLGILGMNRRNAACILDHNPRHRYPLVDDKLRMRDLCLRIGVPTPEIYCAVSATNMLRRLEELLAGRNDFVIKPAHGSAGRGILVIVARDGDRFIRHNGERLRLEHVRQHVSDTLSGMYSLGGRPDQALVQQRVLLHPTFQMISYKGIPDVRVVVYRGEPAMAMLRLPTKQSNGRANLHQGGIGTGVDLDTGITNHAVQCNRMVERHPDTAVPLVGVQVPYWEQILDMAQKVAAAVRLGYVGVDIVVDVSQGPMLLEANARPGLAIQIANNKGLLPRLAEIDRLIAERKKPRIEAHRVILRTSDEPLQKAA